MDIKTKSSPVAASVTMTEPSSSDIADGEQIRMSLPVRFKLGLARAKKTITTRNGWIGDYDYGYLFTPSIWPFNTKYLGTEQPFFGVDDELPILLTFLLGLQHALTLVVGVVAPPLLVARVAFNLDTLDSQYLVSAVLLTTGVISAVQITRFHIYKTPYYIGTGLLSVVGPTFDVFGIAYSYASSRYAKGTCPVTDDGKFLPCPEAWGAVVGTVLVTVWVQLLMALVKPRILKRIFPTLVTGTLLVFLAAYLAGSGMKNWGGGSGCYGKTGVSAICAGGNPGVWGNARYIGLGFSVIASIVLIELFGSPFMKSSAIIFGLAVGCIISGATGYWDITAIKEAPVATFWWTRTFPISVDGALVLPLLIMFMVQGVSCIPDILATSQASRLEVNSDNFNSRVQGGIMCDGLGSLFAALTGSLPMVSQAANNGVILLTNCAARRAGYMAAALLFLMGIFGKVGAIFVAMPSSVLGGMQVFLFGTIGVAGFKILSSVPYTRRNRFILCCAFSMGFAGCIIPTWFSGVIVYNGNNVTLQGFIEGIELIVETPFLLPAVLATFLNLIIPDPAPKADDIDNVIEPGLPL